MKPLTKKILEAGLVDKHLALAMEKWGTLERGSSDLVGTKQVTKETFQAFADDIATLVEVEVPLRETILDFEVHGERLVCIVQGLEPFYGYWDEMMRIVVGPKNRVELGDIIRVTKSDSPLGDSTSWRIILIDPVYVNEDMIAKRLSTSVP